MDTSGGNNKTLPNRATLEHLTRQTEGGTDDMSNLAAACHSCNSYRGGLDHVKYKKIRVALIPVWPKGTVPTGQGLTIMNALKLLFGGH
jgi:hypothetical protein